MHFISLSSQHCLFACVLTGAGVSLGCSLPAIAQQALPAETTTASIDAAIPISTERPTVGPSPDLIPAGSLQVENGASISIQRDQSIVDLPETLLRMGLSKRWELRVQASDPAYHFRHVAGTSGLGSFDAAISAKTLISAPNSLLPKSAIFNLSLPTGSSPYTSGSYDPAVAVIWTQTTHSGYFLNEAAQATLTTYFGARRAIWGPSIVGGRSLGPRITGFAEYAPTPLPDHTVPYTVDGGFAYAGSKPQQFDCRTGYTRDAAGLHLLLSVGYSIRRDRFLPSFR